MEQKISNGWLESHRDPHVNTASAAFFTEAAALHFAEVMTAQMKKAGMTIPKLAAAIGVNDLVVQNMLEGNARLSMEDMARYADAVKCTICFKFMPKRRDDETRPASKTED